MWLNSYNSDLYELTEYRSVHLIKPSKKGGMYPSVFINLMSM